MCQPRLVSVISSNELRRFFNEWKFLDQNYENFRLDDLRQVCRMRKMGIIGFWWEKVTKTAAILQVRTPGMIQAAVWLLGFRPRLGAWKVI